MDNKQIAKMRITKWKNSLNLQQKFSLLGFAFFICILFLSGMVMSDLSARGILTGSALILIFVIFAAAFAKLLGKFFVGLEGVRNQMAEAADKIRSISTDASESSFKLAAASAEQSSAVYQSISNMEEMESKLGQAVKHSSEALKFSEESLIEALDGKAVVDNLSASMLEIEHSTEQLEAVNRLVQEIGEKTKVINDIVFKTQLLSFNASIEAARAGQYGRGFSVVASEIGKLAIMSGAAAKDISKLLGDSAKKVAEIVNSTKHKVNHAHGMSQKCATVFECLTDRAGKVKGVMNSITETAAEQEVEMQTFSQAMTEMRGSAGETNRLAHASSQLSGTLRAHSQLLARTLDSLNGVILGQGNLVQASAKKSSVVSSIAQNKPLPQQDDLAPSAKFKI